MNIKLQRQKRKAEVNIVPLVDVLTVLIFFFLITMQFKQMYAVDITPPKMESSTSTAVAKPNTVAVRKDGRYFYNGDEISLNAFKEKIAELELDENASLILVADEETPLVFVTDAIDVVKLSKIKKLSLQTNK